MSIKKPLTILLAEDDPIAAILAQGMLEDEGHQVQLVTNGSEATQEAAKNHFDVILMDITMPILDGLSATRNIRGTTGPNAETPIIGLTADDSTDMVVSAKRAGMTALYSKPIEPDVLARVTAPA
ncbi:response regulator [Magnetococcus sp. PR-3]|uniref:response regulator n=1 Tax=Magnetococcus sp. PR-3 TaxID=3120355 RepID=UPI002FCE67C5